MAAAKREVAESSFDFLHYSIVDTFSRCVLCFLSSPSSIDAAPAGWTWHLVLRPKQVHART